jgi:hypothetical protein
MTDTSAVTLKVGDSLRLRSVMYGPGDFAGWFTNPNTGAGATTETSTFVGYGTQTVTLPCVAGGTVVLYAHWVAPKPQLGPVAIGISVLIPGEETISIASLSNEVNCDVDPDQCALIAMARAADVNANDTVTLWLIDLFGYFYPMENSPITPSNLDRSKFGTITLRTPSGTAIIEAHGYTEISGFPFLIAFHDDTVDLGSLTFLQSEDLTVDVTYFDVVYDGQHFYFKAIHAALFG